MPDPDRTVADVVADLRAQLAEAKAVLREAEWVRMSNGNEGEELACPLCFDCDAAYSEPGAKHSGHAPDCRLAKVLSG